MEYEANAFCPGCGQLKSKAWDEDTSDSWQHETVKCFACEGHEQAQKNDSEPEPGELKFLSLNEDDVRRAKARKNAPKIDLDSL